MQAYGPSGANHWCLACVEERRLEEMRQDPDAYARTFALNATGSYPADDTPHLSGSRNRPGVREPAADDTARWILTSDGRKFGPFADIREVDRFVVGNHIRLDIEDFDILGKDEIGETPDEHQDFRAEKQAREDALVARFVSGELSPSDQYDMYARGEISPWLNGAITAALDERDGRTRYPTEKIDKREARKRWERGLPVAMAGERGWFDDPDSFSYASNFARKDPWGDFDELVNNSTRGGVKAFAKPVVTGSLADEIRPVAPSEIKAGDRIESDGVGNWKVLSVETGPEGVVTLTMPLGNSTNPGTRLRFLPGPGVIEYVGKDGEVFKTVPGTTIPVHASQTDPIVVRERIAEQFPRATFNEDEFDPNERTYWFVDGQTVSASRRPADAPCARWTTTTPRWVPPRTWWTGSTPKPRPRRPPASRNGTRCVPVSSPHGSRTRDQKTWCTERGDAERNPPDKYLA